MAEKSYLGAQNIRRRVVEALRALPKEGPEPFFLIIQESHLQNLIETMQNASKIRNRETAAKELDEITMYAKGLAKESDRLSLEEKEELMEEVLKKRKENQAK
jgi:hypothetical protein